MGKQHNIPTLVVLLFLVIGVITGVFLVQEQQYFRLSASSDYVPKDVRITNISENSFNVSFYTDRPSLPNIIYGEDDLDNLVSSESTELKTLHYFMVKNLSPNRNYNFKITIGGKDFDNNGVPWQVQTAAQLGGISPNSEFISGNILSSEGKPGSNALVYIQIGGASSISTQASLEGTFLISLSLLRTQIGDKYFKLDGNELINIFVQGGSLGVATAKATISSARPLPTIVFGSSHDFTDLETTVTGSLPSAEISLPEDNSPESRFELSNTPLRVKRN